MAQTPQPLPQQALYGYDVAPASELFLGTTPLGHFADLGNALKVLKIYEDSPRSPCFFGAFYSSKVSTHKKGFRLAKNGAKAPPPPPAEPAAEHVDGQRLPLSLYRSLGSKKKLGLQGWDQRWDH